MTVTTKQLSQAAMTWKVVVNAGDFHPVKTTASVLGVSIMTAHRRLAAARKLGLLPDRVHEPRQARFDRGRTWLACHTCLVPWPCPPGAKAFAVPSEPEQRGRIAS